METPPAPAEAAARDERSLRRFDLVWLALGSLPLLWNLGALSAWYAEERWLFIVRHMRESGDWFSLVKDGEFYGDKPYFSYWAQAVSAALLGGLDEVTARLPSALAGMGTVLLTAWIGARTLGRRAGLGAGAILLTSFSFAMFSRLATADLWNTFFSTAAIAVYLSLRAKPTLLGFLGFGLSLGLGGQAKGIPAVILPIAVAGADLAVAAFLRRAERPWRAFPWLAAAGGALVAALVFGAAYFGPFVVSYWRTGSWTVFELMWRENFVRALDAFDHNKQGPFYYAYILPAMMAPWTPWIPTGIAYAVARARRDDGSRFVAIAFGVIFLLFTASESRRSYYILPAFPFAAVAAAGFLRDCWAFAPPAASPSAAAPSAAAPAAAAPAPAWRILAWAPAWLLASLAFLGGLALAVGRFLPTAEGEAARLVPYGLALASGLVAGGAVLGAASWRRDGALAVVGVVSLGFLGLLYGVTGGDALRGRSILEREFAARLRGAHPNEAFTFFSMARGIPARYYLGEGPVAKDGGELRARVDAAGERGVLVIVEARFADKLRGQEGIRSEILERATTPPFAGFSSGKDRLYLMRCVPAR